MEKHEIVRTASKKQLFMNNFLGGIAWGLGATIGVSLIVGILSYVLKHVNLVPIIGNLATQVTTIVLKNLQSTPYLLK
jgi:hypothetical protein